MEFLNRLYFMLALNVKNFFTDEDGAVDIVAIVVLIGVAVILAGLFRTQIQGLITNLLNTITQNATDVAAG